MKHYQTETFSKPVTVTAHTNSIFCPRDKTLLTLHQQHPAVV